MKTFPSTFLEKLNSLYDGGKLILLAEINLDSATVRYYTSHDEEIVFDGDTYSPLPVQFEDTSSNSRGEIPSVKVIISNIGNEALEVLETYDILEKTIILSVVNLDLLSDATAKSTTELMVIAVSTNDQGFATLVLGLPVGADEEVPRERFNSQDFPGIPQEANTFGI